MRFNVKIIVLKYLVCFTCLKKACLFLTLLDNDLSCQRIPSKKSPSSYKKPLNR